MARFQLIEGEFFIKRRGIKATALLEGREVVVIREGSTASGDGPHGWGDRFLALGIVERQGPVYRFLRDYPFHNPTPAAEFVLGMCSDGWSVWKNASGQTMKEMRDLAQRQAYGE